LRRPAKRAPISGQIARRERAGCHDRDAVLKVSITPELRPAILTTVRSFPDTRDSQVIHIK
jgi:hypothetical protein